MKVKKLLFLYRLICKKYFYISYITVISIIPLLLYLNIHIDSIFLFTFEDFSKSQIIFYLVSNFLLCLFYHKIINKLIKYNWMEIVTLIWIIPLLTQLIEILKVLVLYLINEYLYLI